LIGADERVEEHRRRQKVYERNSGLGEKASSFAVAPMATMK